MRVGQCGHRTEPELCTCIGRHLWLDKNVKRKREYFQRHMIDKLKDYNEVTSELFGKKKSLPFVLFGGVVGE